MSSIDGGFIEEGKKLITETRSSFEGNRENWHIERGLERPPGLGLNEETEQYLDVLPKKFP